MSVVAHDLPVVGSIGGYVATIAEAVGFIDPAGEDPAQAFGTSLGAAIKHAKPSDPLDFDHPQLSLIHQIVSFHVLVDGEPLDVRLRRGGMRVTRSRFGGVTFDFTTVYGSSDELIGMGIQPSNPLVPGSPRSPELFQGFYLAGKAYPPEWPPTGVPGNQWFGTVAGQTRIDIYGRYMDPTSGLIEVPLVSNGLVEQSQIRFEGGERVLTVSGIGAMGRYDKLETCKLFPAGHGTTRGQVIHTLMLEAGIPNGYATDNWPESRRLYREIHAVHQPWLPIAQAIAEGGGRRITEDRYGRLRTMPIVPGMWTWFFHRFDILDQPITIDGVAEAPTKVLVRSTEQETLDIDECGYQTDPPQVSTASAEYKPVARRAEQDGSGDIVASVQETDDALKVIQRVTVTRTLRCNTPVHESIQIEGFYSPTTWRYLLYSTPEGVDVDGDYDAYHTGAYLYVDASKNDTNTMYAWKTEQFVVTNFDETTWAYDDRGYIKSVIVTRSGWYARRRAIKQRANVSVPWDTVNHDSVRLLANGEAPDGGIDEYFGRVSEEITVYSVTDDGFVTEEVTAVYGWGAGPGAKYLYGDGREFGEPDERWMEKSKRITIYVPRGESSHDKIVTVKDMTTLRGLTVETETNAPGYLPAAERLAAPEADPEDFADARFALRWKTKPGACLVESPFLASAKQQYVVDEELDYAESQAELCEQAQRILSERSSIGLSFTLPANFLLEEGIVFWISIDELNLWNGAVVDSITWQESDVFDPITTEIKAEIFIV